MQKPSILVDTGPLVALLNKKDAQHQRCSDEFSRIGKSLYTCWPVLTEVAHLVKTKASVHSLVASADGTFLNILPLVASDIAGIHSILDQYADQDFDLADACLMHLANRQSIETVFTLDVKDFSVYRNPSGQRLSILPAPPSPA